MTNLWVKLGDNCANWHVQKFINYSNGRAFHYNGSSLLQWKSVRLEVTLNAGDVAGIGWERQGDDTQPLPGQQVKGQVYFTYNGERLAATLDDVSGGMWPVVHIQKKVCLFGF